MRTFGLIGHRLSHSFSKKYFSQKFITENIIDAHYELFQLEDINEFPELLDSEPNLVGLNVTLPYKEAVIPYLDAIDDSAATVGAVNTIHLTDGKRIGYNTDVYGFEKSLRPLLQEHHKRALILGTGGAAKAVAFVLQRLGIDYHFVSRKPKYEQLGYQNITENMLRIFHVIINTTPLGMSPNINASPDIPYEHLTEEHLLFDLVYNPIMTRFLEKGQEHNAVIKNGLEMLHFQAEKAWEIWNE